MLDAGFSSATSRAQLEPRAALVAALGAPRSTSSGRQSTYRASAALQPVIPAANTGTSPAPSSQLIEAAATADEVFQLIDAELGTV